MQTCPECGARNAADAQFCSSCGTFLAWEDRPSPGGSSATTSPPRPESPGTETPRPEAPRPADPPPRSWPGGVVGTSGKVSPMPPSTPPRTRSSPPARTSPPPVRPPDGTDT
ncbi:MAG: zinc-ribbon domain-containing protein, partial [Actinomycetota bacterium]